MLGCTLTVTKVKIKFKYNKKLKKKLTKIREKSIWGTLPCDLPMTKEAV